MSDWQETNESPSDGVVNEVSVDDVADDESTAQDPDIESVDGEVTFDGTESVEPGAAPKKRRKAAGQSRRMTRDEVKRAVDAYDVLRDERYVAFVKTFLDTRSNDPCLLVSALSETKNRRRMAGFASTVKRLGTSDPNELRFNLGIAFAEDKSLPKTLFAFLNGVAPDREFGAATGDARKDATAIAEHWDQSIDLSAIEKLSF